MDDEQLVPGQLVRLLDPLRDGEFRRVVEQVSLEAWLLEDLIRKSRAVFQRTAFEVVDPALALLDQMALKEFNELRRQDDAQERLLDSYKQWLSNASLYASESEDEDA